MGHLLLFFLHQNSSLFNCSLKKMYFSNGCNFEMITNIVTKFAVNLVKKNLLQ